MAKYIVKSPVDGYNGMSAGVQFKDGVGITQNANSAEWLKKKGYSVKKDVPRKKKDE